MFSAATSAAEVSHDDQPTAPMAELGVLSADFSFAAVGDLLQVRPIVPMQDQSFKEVQSILQSADATFGNGEMPLLDLDVFDGYPAAENGGSNAFGSIAVAHDWREMGLSLISRANNHVEDWGVTGMEVTNTALREAGLVYAGSGANEAAARRAHFLETSKGRVALAAVTTNFTKMQPAGSPLGEVKGRPGTSVLRATPYVLVEQAAIDSMKKFYGSMAYRPGETQPEPRDQVTINGDIYRAGTHAGIEYEADKADQAAVLQAVREGKQAANFLVFSVHSHEAASGIENDLPLADFVGQLAHSAIDAGADVVVGHGPHQLGGIEIYHGRPIFYSLGDFIFQLDLLEAIYPEAWAGLKLDPKRVTSVEFMRELERRHFADDKFWQSAIAVSLYKHGKLAEIRIYPLVLGMLESASRRGVPRLASPDVGRNIIGRISESSKPYNTTIAFEHGIGVIRIHGTDAK
jgi:hypothetical protein